MRIVLAFVAVLGMACSSADEKSAAELAALANAELLCERLFSCCTPSDLDALPFVADTKPPTRQSCVSFHEKTALEYLPLTEKEAAAARVAMHVDRSASCVERLRAEGCSEFHRRLPRLHLGDAFALCSPDVVEPLVLAGQACQQYLDCKKGYCDAAGTCRGFPNAGEPCGADGCAEQLRCDPDVSVCQAYVALGAACRDDNACASGACRDGKCVSPGRCGG